MSRLAQIKSTPHNLKEAIHQRYSSKLLDLSPLTDVRFRHFRLRLLDDSFHKIKRKIRGARDLQEYLAEYLPLDVYYSTATWLNPHLIASRLDKDILKNIYLGCDLSFDIDVSSRISTLPDAKREALKLHDFLSERGFRIRYRAFSGSKGFHVVCDDPWGGFDDPDPRRRELRAIEERKLLVAEASREGILFDEKVTVDTRRIIRLPGTINSKTGLACITLTKVGLDAPIEDILKSAAREGIVAPRIPFREMTAPSANKIPGSPGRLGVRPRPTLSYALYFTNNVPGTSLKVPIMEFEGWMRQGDILRIIDEAQRIYGLGTVFLFRDEEKYWGMSLKALQRRRVEKILGFTGSRNLNQSKKYGCTYTRIGRSVDEDDETEQTEPRFLKMIESRLSGQASRTHLEFLASLGIDVNGIDAELCGAGLSRLEMVHAVID